MLQEHERLSLDQVAQQIRVACEKVDSLTHSIQIPNQREKLSEAFEDLFLLLEQFRFSEKDLRVKDDQQLSVQEIVMIERERYQELFEVSPDPYFMTTPDNSIQECNLAASEILRIDKQELIGLSLLLFIDEEVHSELRSRLHGLDGENVLHGVEFQLRPREGKPLDAKVSVGLFHDALGNPAGLHWFLRDITAQKQMEQALKLSDERFRSIAEMARDAILVMDGSGKIISWNKGAMDTFGYSEQEAVGQSFLMLLPESEKEKCASLLEKVDDPEKAVEMQVLRRDGSEFSAEISLSGWNSAGNRYLGGIIRDITERRQAEETRNRLLERVLTAQEEDRRWIARELHDETGQSLSSLLVGLRMIEDARTLKKARLEAGRLRAITSQTLDDLGRLAKGLRPIILDDLGLVVALKRHAAEFGRSFGISIDFKVHGIDSRRLPLAVETALFRIAQEALTNIAKHAGAKNIQIALEETENTIELKLWDDGRGFDVEETLRTAAAAEHLGLHGMRERAALLGGNVKIDSKTQKGTVVHAWISKARIYSSNESRTI